LFWGCSDDKFGSDSSSGKQISFRLQGNLPSSRATGTTVENINAFVVNAQVHGENGSILSGDAGKLFSSQTVARLEGTANAFDYSPKRYYPDAAAFAYYSAYSPVTGKVGGFMGRTDNTITYTVPKPDIDGNTTQEDLLVAYTKVKGGVQDPGGKPVSRGEFENAVSLNFKHALSRVFVRASNKNKEPVVITGLILHNLYSSGMLKIDGDTWKEAADGTADINEDYIKKEDIASADDPYKVLWTDFADLTSYEYVLLPTGVSVPAETDKLGTDAKYVSVVGKDQGMLVLPQTTVNTNNDAEITPDEVNTDFYVEVIYSINNAKYQKRYAAFTDLNDLAGGLTFEMGRQYALTLEFSDKAVEFKISVEGWEDDTDAYAATTVVFAENKPEGVTDALTDPVHDANSGFIYGQPLPALESNPAPDDTPPTLAGWKFLGYYDSRVGGTQYYTADLTPAVTEWDKIGTSSTLYAHWEEDYPDHAQSNIYFKPDDPDDPNCSVGSLTFIEKNATAEQQGYQGLYFKWGSLIGVSPTGAFNGNAYLYIPDVSPGANCGKYYKVKVNKVKATDAVPAVKKFYTNAVSGWAGTGNVGTTPNNDWSRIPYATDAFTSAHGDRSQSPLTDHHSTLLSDYQGDICKFLSDNKVASKLNRSWVMPTSDKWEGSGYDTYENVNNSLPSGFNYMPNQFWSSGPFTSSDAADGMGVHFTALMTYTYDTYETATFPASGCRVSSNGSLFGIGNNGFYWSSSVNDASHAYGLGFISYEVNPADGDNRAYGASVRCVKN
jgi:hypothetical protein